MRLLSITLFLLHASLLPAQPKEPDTFLQDYARTGRFLRGRPIEPMPTPDGKAVLFLRSGPRSPQLSLFEFDVATGKTRSLLTAEQLLKGAVEKLSPEEKAIRERMRLTASGFASFHLSKDGSKILLPLAGRLYLFERKDGAITELKTGKGPLLDPKFSPDMRYVSYVRDHDVHLYELATGKETRLTKGGTDEVSHGLAEFVAQEEMSRFSGYWWAPDGKSVVFQESDAREVETWYVADPFDPGAVPTPFRYPRPGKNNVDVKVGVARVPDGKTTWIEWDRKKYPYLVTVRWEKNGPLLMTVQTRDQRDMTLLRVDPETGGTTPTVSETDPAWVNIYQDVPRWLPGEKAFLWISEREGGPQLEVRSLNGSPPRVLVPKEQGFYMLIGVDEEKAWVYYTANPVPTEARVYRVNLRGEPKPELLSKQKGVHGGVINVPSGLLVMTSNVWDASSPAEAMPRTRVFEAKAMKELGELPSIAEEPPFVPRVEMVRAGEKEFYAAVTLPRAFDATRKYPVLLDVYGGPHHVHVSGTRGRWLLNQWFADRGFIVVAIDGRGTPRRGRDWERAIFQKFGSVPLEDQVEGLLALGERYPAMDLKRVGVMGWSYGGTMSAMAVLKRPDIFRAAAAGAPVSDWYDYDTHYTERYLGIPPEADEAYEEASLIPLAKDLSRPLLLLHGTADDNVYFRHTLKLSDALMRHGKDFELVPMAGFTHRVADPQAWERMQQRILRFLRTNTR